MQIFINLYANFWKKFVVFANSFQDEVIAFKQDSHKHAETHSDIFAEMLTMLHSARLFRNTLYICCISECIG